MRLSISACMLLAVATSVAAQQSRPIPYPVFETPQFARAVEQGTRSRDGRPGPSYWTNTAEYDIDVTVSPAAATVSGAESIRYHNNSPDVLRRIVLNLYQNLYREGAARNRNVVPTEGLNLSCAFVNDAPILQQADPRLKGFVVAGTKMVIHLVDPVEPGGSVDMRFCWDFRIPASYDNIRMGHDGEVYYLAYWYPQVAVYDDVTGGIGYGDGWDLDHYLGNGEFYMGYADYDVSITVPEGYLVPATGVLQNPKEILSPAVLARIDSAAKGPDVVGIVTDENREDAFVPSPSGTATWRYAAENVRDFAFGLSDLYRWDATFAEAGDWDADGTSDRAMIHAFYRPGTPAWERSAEYGKFSIEHLSRTMMPYPWPHMTAVEGLIGGGMEYPMITLIGGSRSPGALFSVTYHEIGHMWFPMIVGQDEKKFTWMDEGLTSFNQTNGIRDFNDSPDVWRPDRQPYYRIAGSGYEVESMRHGDEYPYGTDARGLASYNKPAVMLHALRGLLGEDLFYKAFRAYAHRWAYKHPTPFDLFNTFEDVTGQDLDWFWTPAFFETWTLDQAVAAVEAGEVEVKVTIKDLGLTPMPAPVTVTYADGRQESERLGVEPWLEGARETSLTFPPGQVAKVEIDPEGFLPDVDRSNNVWEAASSN
ncbi:MAG TPA: M1 family metallopeptidase [Rhodothermales bacterium]|nr:M1 family metallopeptidase [Rhodothermales bacterium]